MDEVRLYFNTGRALRLVRTECVSRSALYITISSGSGARRKDIGVFRWSRGVKILSILFVRLALATLNSSVEPRIEGGRGSMAASLDGVISQEPLWLVDMFGRLKDKKPRCRRLFVRSNPGRKRSGPVAVSFSQRVRGESVRVFLDGTPVLGKQSLERIHMDLMEQVL